MPALVGLAGFLKSAAFPAFPAASSSALAIARALD